MCLPANACWMIPDFPPTSQYKPAAMGAQKLLERLRDEKGINWTVLAPSAVIALGERTGKFRLEKDRLLVNEKGESRVSVEDFVMALVDELEIPRFSRTRFTVGY
jgi:putative NADH-flavin reductase|uniref:NAD(P)-binding domain-containing protein n=1 Tax=Leptospirillum ferriphilum TaxID=178606 RepID=A0A7C3QZX8_9BACT